MEQVQKKSHLSTPGEADGLQPQTLIRKVTVIYGSNEVNDVDVFPGQTVKELLASTELREQVGYGNVKEGNVRYAIDGNVVDENAKISDYKVQGEEQLQIEILRQVGEKA